MTNFHYRVKAQQLHPILAIALIAPRVLSADHTNTTSLLRRMYIAMAKLLLQANNLTHAHTKPMTPTTFKECVEPAHGESPSYLALLNLVDDTWNFCCAKPIDTKKRTT